MATIKTMHDAFIHELGDVFDAEHQLTEVLPELSKLAQHPQVKRGLQQHLRDTDQQIQNLELVFQSCGVKPAKMTCKGMAGIIGENKTMLKDIKEEALTDSAIVGGGGKVEHYEIASYRSLVAKATLMGHQSAAQLLKQNLQMEENFAQELEQLQQQLGQELAGLGSQFIGHDVPGSHTSTMGGH